MPKQTFFNLPEEKRSIIEQAAMDEFTEYGFDKSNMNRIVDQSKIAKGSFYQYFEDKKDLYFHLIDAVVTRKIKALAPVLDHYGEHIFAYNLEELFRIGLEFADSDPKLYRLGEDFTTKKPELVKGFIEKYSPTALDLYEKLLETAAQKGELRDDLDLHLTGSIINTLINQTVLVLIGQPKDKRDYVIRQLLTFIERAVLKNEQEVICHD